MKIAFHGGARMVTGSKYLLDIHPDRKILLDCGMFQGMGKETASLNSQWGFDPASLTEVILSHAHIDHIGLLPKLVKDGYRGKIYCTPATAAIARILLIDSARIQESDIRYVNKLRGKENRPLLTPLYTEEDAQEVFSLFHPHPYQEPLKIDDQVELLFTDSGHIMGSAAINLRIREGDRLIRLCFSGDVGRYRSMLLRSPAPFPQADYIIMESTYGDSLHELSIMASDRLQKHIQTTCVERRGKLVIPAFSLGRTQEVLYLLNRLETENRLPPLKYYVDSPLSIKITETIKRFQEDFNDQVQRLLEVDEDVFAFQGLEYLHSAEDSMALNGSREPAVIISASGMAEAGRVKHHIAHHIEDSRNTILFTGYCEPASLGGRLKNRPEAVSIFGKPYKVKAEIAEIDSLSAHADYEDLSQWLACQDPRQVRQLFLVHGEYDVQHKFQSRLIRKGFLDVQIPAMHQIVGLGED